MYIIFKNSGNCLAYFNGNPTVLNSGAITFDKEKAYKFDNLLVAQRYAKINNMEVANG